ncbi:MAG TPA: glutamine synthetase type III [Deltaproteobacteria bacterium]|nr:glutamine synthetase type III [Deltaproteobacteria bacterium]
MKVTEIFGSNVFNDKVMKERLPKEIYRALKETIDMDVPLRPEVADVVANAMKDWAIEKGATHYTHWFQPLTGITAEKHDSFISPASNGSVIVEFSGKQLIQGEPDASSFPSGGLRTTFEARGYTAWDCTSPAFLKTDESGNCTLTIPTAFYSYKGEALDKKTPLLRSMKAVSKHALRVLRALGNTTSAKVTSTVGPEQEYFLVDREYYLKRTDLMLTGRTVFGAPAPKGQELEDQYFGAIKDRVSDYMSDLNAELWKIGITSKTQHNEVAPAQYEMAPIFATTNIATDHNQLVMETMQKVAFRHGLVCLLHEKPYAGINGSGKHNNWSLSTDDGVNLLDPGHTPGENVQFLLVLCGLLKAVDTHADILRATCASAANDHRLGANEAPPAIISIFMGEELTEILEKIVQGKKITGRDKEFLHVGVDSLPMFPKDNTDRNRTSPFAFTGNKFEFRMVGSSQSIAGPNVALNTIAAEVFDEIATRLEKAKNINSEATAIINEFYKKHSRVIFNGNNYSDEWLGEAQKRGLPNITNSVDALAAFVTAKSLKLFGRYEVFSEKELHSRYEIYVDHYAKQINIEALTAIDMAKKQLIPAGIEYAAFLANSISSLKAVSAKSPVAEDLLQKVSSLLTASYTNLDKLEKGVAEAQRTDETVKKAELYRDKVVTSMQALRADIDALEMIVPSDMWPVPIYAELLFNL